MRNSTLGIICHGGAGVVEDKEAAAQGLATAIEAGYKLLRQSADALEAVVEAIRILEDNPVFNCGTGSMLTSAGRAEMDAAVMTQTGEFGAVAGISAVRNPVLVARRVMGDTDHLLLAGGGAVEFARKSGFEEYDVMTERSRERLERLSKEGESAGPDLTAAREPGTVGAVAIDRHGRLAAAASSGGATGRLAGRVGDAALMGAGVFAGPSGAVSCAGHAEAVMRLMLARDIVDRMKTMPASVATTLGVAEARRRKLMVGVVGFDARAGVCFGHTTPDMPYGYMVADRLFMSKEEKRRRPGLMR